MTAIAASPFRAVGEFVRCVLCALLGLIAVAAHATAGQPGTLITPIRPRDDFVPTMAVQPDGRVLVALLPDGKFLLAGTCLDLGNNDFCLLRFNANGAIDSSFGSNGAIITPIGTGDDRAGALQLQPDGKIVIAGTCNDSANDDFCAARYLPSGTLDASFGNGGKVITAFSTRDDVMNAIALQPDGKLLLAGYCRSGSFDKFCVVRYDGGPFSAPACSLDIDGDNQVLATTDALIHARIALGIRGDAVGAGITFPINAQRKTWTQIRGHLVSMCGMVLPL